MKAMIKAKKNNVFHLLCLLITNIISFWARQQNNN